MLHYYAIENGRLQPLPQATDGCLPEAAVWIDLVTPTHEEEHALEQQIGVDVPTRDEVSEIQTSSRLLAKNDALYMTAIIPYGRENERLQTLPVTFVRTGQRLITIRYGLPESVDRFVQRAGHGDWELKDADSVLAALLEVVVDRIADRLEYIGKDLRRIEQAIFDRIRAGVARRPSYRPSVGRRIRALQNALESIGSHHMVSFELRGCLQSMERLLAFRRGHAEKQPWFRSIELDLHAIAEYDNDLNNSMNFMIDATVGLIDVQQNKVIYILSIAGIVISPPMLVASIYGMNFDDMPELHWPGGYPWALGLMLVSAVVPWLVFKFKRWL